MLLHLGQRAEQDKEHLGEHPVGQGRSHIADTAHTIAEVEHVEGVQPDDKEVENKPMDDSNEDLGDYEVVECAEGYKVGDDSIAGEVSVELATGEGAPSHGLRDDSGQEAEGHKDDPGADTGAGSFQTCHRANCDGHKSCRGKSALLKGNRTIADLRYGGKGIISPSTLIFSLIKG